MMKPGSSGRLHDTYSEEERHAWRMHRQTSDVPTMRRPIHFKMLQYGGMSARGRWTSVGNAEPVCE